MHLSKTKARKNCPTCKGKFHPARATVKYCSASCKKTAANKRQAKKQEVGFQTTAFGSWLVGQCRRAGTVQILQGFDINDLYKVWARCRKANGFNVSEDDPSPKFEISHIAPVTAVGAIGTLHPNNLVIAPAYYNRSRCNNWDNKSGVWLRPIDLLPTWKVYPELTAKEVAEKIVKFNPVGFSALVSNVKLAASFRVKMINTLMKTGLFQLRQLQAQPYESLVALYEVLQTTKQTEGKKIYRLDRLTSFEVYQSECQRLEVEGVDDYNLFSRCETECWDHLHGGILTVYFDGLNF
ncbi:hypothetical protein [Pseudomonas sp. S9]|uniref:hypothetical protein n=1 Tax=Pseudomonas sp. S9 TaxID=686578 RepID=UPI0011104EB2|nr:hypothetical protein [Pseudomonas sp. S9]